MRNLVLACLLLIPTWARGEGVGRLMPWSPDGKWFAYTVESPSGGATPPPGWLFGEGSPGPDRADDPATFADASRVCRLWATRADLGVSVLLDESRGFLLSPAWSPDGRSVAFGRRGEGEEGGRGTFEVVIWEGPARRRVVSNSPLPADPEQVRRIAGEGVAWSHDGRYLAAPSAETPGLVILRASDGRQVNAIPGAKLPAWSPEGSRLAFFVPGESGDALAWIESALGRPGVLVEVGRGLQPPAWTRDGLTTVIFGKRRADPRLVGRPITPVDLIRIRVDTGQVETIRPLANEQGLDGVRPIESVAFAIDRDAESLFSATSIPGRDHRIVWFRPREALVRDRMPILDPSMPIDVISPSPDGTVLALRVGPRDRPSPPLLVDLEAREHRVRAAVPDDSARAAWLALLVDSARTALRNRASALPADSRPTLLPTPGELEPADDLTRRIRDVGRLARGLCDRPSDDPRVEPALAALLDEARLFFDYLTEDYAAALASLEAFEPRADTPERRLALLGLRAQIAMGRGEFDRADRLIAFLRTIEPKPARRLEWTASGPVLTADAKPEASWVASLEARSTLLRNVDKEAPTAFPAEINHFNPDAPQPGLGLDPIVPGMLERPIFIQPPPRVPAQPPAGGNPPKTRVIRVLPPPAPLP